MKSNLFRIISALTVLSLALLACGVFSQVPSQTPSVAPIVSTATAQVGEQPYEIIGDFTYTNDIITTYYVENAVALVDMYGFVKRDKEWEIPVDSQTLGFLSIDSQAKTGRYILQLPAKPTGKQVDVANDGNKSIGVQVFSVSYWPNLTGGPYSEGDDPSKGWPTYLASIVTDSENKDEVVSGNLVVWAPDANQKFPTGFGADKKLFTEDDPIGAIPAGYLIINLDKEPFTVSQAAQPSLTLYEPKEAAIKDFSNESYSKAFDDTFNLIRKNYAFSGIQGKEPNWDKLYAELQPRVTAAESKKDPNAFYLALRDFTWAFKDGHVGLDGGQYANDDFTKAISGGYGFAIRQLDDGRVTVIFVLDGGPAAKAGIKVGAEVTEFNGQPIKAAIAAAHSYSTQSSDFAIQYQQARYLLRAQPDTEAKVTFTNPGGKSQSSVLKAVAERDSFARTSLYYGLDSSQLLPLEYKIIPAGNKNIGYIMINSNYDDLNLIIRLFQRALTQFRDQKVDGLIIDMRYNSGGAPLGLAGFLYKKDIVMGQLQYYSDETKKFEADGNPEKITPNMEQYHFDKMAVLVGPACFSACELESFGFSKVPDMMVVGQYPTAGVEAEVSRGQFKLPEGMSLQVPFGRFVNPDGSLFLEGQGVQPTVKVPINEKTAISTDDVVLNAAVDAVLGKSSANTEPVPAASAPPKLTVDSSAESALTSGTKFLEDLAKEKYQAEDYVKPGTLAYTINLAKSADLMWVYGWCAASAELLKQNLDNMTIVFNLDGQEIPSADMAVFDASSGGQQCKYIYGLLSSWPVGQHHLTITSTYNAKINDGSAEYEPGSYILDYTVNVNK